MRQFLFLVVTPLLDATLAYLLLRYLTDLRYQIILTIAFIVWIFSFMIMNHIVNKNQVKESTRRNRQHQDQSPDSFGNHSQDGSIK